MDSSKEFPPDEEYYRQCGEIFLTIKGDLLIHCSLCETRYKDFRDYAEHISRGHYQEDLGSEELECLNEEAYGKEFICNNSDLEGIDQKIETQTYSTYEEEQFLEIFSDNENFEMYSNISDNDMESVEGKTRNPGKYKDKPGLKRKLSKQKNWRQICPECGTFFTDRSNLIAHIKRHSSTKSHHCNMCPKSFFTRTELKTHVRSHTGEKPYVCSKCGQGFSTSSKLTLHLKMHANIRDKECHLCGMKFFTHTAVRNHAKVHSKDRPFKCEICNGSFKLKRALNSHMKAHKNKLEKKSR